MPPLGLTLAQLRIKRGLGGGKGDKAVKATWKAKDASVGWHLKINAWNISFLLGWTCSISMIIYTPEV